MMRICIRPVLYAVLVAVAIWCVFAPKSVQAQGCVSGAQISSLVNQGLIVPVSQVRVSGQILRVEQVCQQGGRYVYVLVVQNGQRVSRVTVNASR